MGKDERSGGLHKRSAEDWGDRDRALSERFVIQMRATQHAISIGKGRCAKERPAEILSRLSKLFFSI